MDFLSFVTQNGLLLPAMVETRPIGCISGKPPSSSPREPNVAARYRLLQSVLGLLAEWLAMTGPNQLDPKHL